MFPLKSPRSLFTTAAACAAIFCACRVCLPQPALAGAPRDGAFFQMRGVVLTVDDLESADWAKLALENGINTIGTHVTPAQVAKYAESEKGKKFFADCKEHGILVEHQLHAMSDLLPRELFDNDPSMFRMDESGRRVREHNFCVHSEKALGIVAKNAARYARLLPAANHRYYFWLDDNAPRANSVSVCHCPECARYSASEQALIVENRMLREIRKIDPKARLAHLAYSTTIQAPRRVRPAEGIFLEFAPYYRSWETPLSDPDAPGRAVEGRETDTHGLILRHLQENLAVFPVETAVVLEYWLDVSLFNRMNKTTTKLPWRKDVFEADLKTYASLGVKNVTSFAAGANGEYLASFPEFRQYLAEYGGGLKNLTPPDAAAAGQGQSHEIKSAVVQDGAIKVGSDKIEPAWAQAPRIESFANPWDDGKFPDTTLSVLHDSQNFYFLYVVRDDDLVLAPDFSSKRDVEKEDRVELFFSKDKGMGEYCGFEIDPLGRVLSYKCRYYRDFDFSWNPPAGFLASGKIYPGGYIVKCAVPRSFLRDFVREDGAIYFGAYRAQFVMRDGKIVENWLAWKDPLTAFPDFHVPASLGKLKF